MGTAGDPSELIRKFSDPDLKELQLVANAVKHGDGKAHRQLKSMKAAVVDPTRVDNDWTVGEFSALTIALSVNAADIVRYRDAVLRFWSIEGTFFAKRARFDGPKEGRCVEAVLEAISAASGPCLCGTRRKWGITRWTF